MKSINSMQWARGQSLAIAFSFLACNHSNAVEMILHHLPVHPDNINVFATPIAYYQGDVFTVNIEPYAQTENGINLHTVVRHGHKVESGSWQWKSTVIELETLSDPYHTQASIGIDENGYIHVAYNMHNMPWQYVVSESPASIDNFIFMGKHISAGDKKRVKHENKTSFPGMGHAAIPGNQITYPAFFNDRNGKLYITYRYAIKPKRIFSERAFANSIAGYDSKTKTWSQIGGNITTHSDDALLPEGLTSINTKPFLFDEGWVAYLIRLAFDQNNSMHISWTWRQHGAGRETQYPGHAVIADKSSTAKQANGSPYPELPIDFSSSDKITGADDSMYFALTSPVISANSPPGVIVSPASGGRSLVTFDPRKNTWNKPEKTPYAASRIIIDDDGESWAFASGIKILKKSALNNKWTLVYSDEENNLCHPKVLPVYAERFFLVHAQHCDNKLIKIFRIDWDENPVTGKRL